MNYLEGILVVEGSKDASFISSFLNTEIVVLNGCELANLDYLIEASKSTNIYLLTDPDEEGIKIRNKINEKLHVTNIEIDILSCNKNSKHGVAESNKEEILKRLEKYIKTSTKPVKNVISIEQVIGLKNKDEIKKKFHLGRCNTKTMFKRLNTLEISLEKINGNN